MSFLTFPFNVMVRAIICASLATMLPSTVSAQTQDVSPGLVPGGNIQSAAQTVTSDNQSDIPAATRTSREQREMKGNKRLQDLKIPENSSCENEIPFDALSEPWAHRRFERPRPAVNGDYFVILYDAGNNTTAWWDYNHLVQAPPSISYSGRAFLPVIYSREKLAVHVCNLHISDSLTVTMSPTPVPENGADFRGAPATSVSSVAASTDTLFSAGSTGSVTTPGTLGYASSTSLAITGVAGYNAGVNSPGKSTDPGNPSPPVYTDATITIAPKQLATLMQTTVHDAASVLKDVAQFKTGSYWSTSGHDYPGSIDGVTSDAQRIVSDLPSVVPENNPGKFNHFVDEASILAGEMNALGTALGATSLGARAEAIRTNYGTLHGILELAKGVEDADADLNGKTDTTLSVSPCGTGNKSLKEAKCDAALKAKGIDPSKLCSGGQNGADTATCKYFEWKTFSDFIISYCTEFGLQGDLGRCLNFGAVETSAAVGSVDELHRNLAALDGTVAFIFQRMNDWYGGSQVDQTDILTPAGTNAVERVSILIHRTYIPFTLVGSSQSAGGSSSSGATGASGASGSGGGGGGSAGSAPGGSGGGAGGSGGAGGAGGTTASGGASATGGAAISSSAFTAETVLVEVHRRANFNVVGGAMAIRVPTNNYTLLAEFAPQTTNSNTASGQPLYIYPATCDDGKTPQDLPVTPSAGIWPSSAPFYCIAQQQTSRWQVAGMAGVDWFFLGRDYFPYGTGGRVRMVNFIPSIMAATSVTSLGNFFLGPDLEPASGINFFAGVATAHQTTLPSGYSLTTVLDPVGSNNSPPTLPSATHVKWGLSIGIGFDFSVFTQLFGKASGASAP